MVTGLNDGSTVSEIEDPKGHQTIVRDHEVRRYRSRPRRKRARRDRLRPLNLAHRSALPPNARGRAYDDGRARGTDAPPRKH